MLFFIDNWVRSRAILVTPASGKIKRVCASIKIRVWKLYSELRSYNEHFETDLLPKLKKSKPIFRIQNLKPLKYSTNKKGKEVLNDAVELFYRIKHVYLLTSILEEKKKLPKKYVKDIKGLKHASINLMESMLENMIKAVGKNQGKLLKSQIFDNLEFLSKIDI